MKRNNEQEYNENKSGYLGGGERWIRWRTSVSWNKLCWETAADITNLQEEKNKTKASPVRGREGLWGCETSRFQFLQDSWLKDDGEFVILKRWPSLAPNKIPGIQFRQKLNRTQGYSAAEMIRSTENPVTSGMEPVTFRFEV
jgi:hypothetical protein